MNTNGIAFKLSMYYDESIHGFIEKLLDNLPFKLKKMSPATIHKKPIIIKLPFMIYYTVLLRETFVFQHLFHKILIIQLC